MFSNIGATTPQGGQEYNVYHAQDCLSANALAILKERGFLPQFVRTVHHIEDFKSPYLRDCQQKSIVQSDRCLCVSKQWQQVLKTEYGIEAHRVVNGVGSQFLTYEEDERPLEEARYLLASLIERSTQSNLVSESNLVGKTGLVGGPLYMTVGGIEPRKNSINLLKAFVAVRAAQPAAKLLIVGGATLFDYQDYRDQFMALASRYGVTDGLLLPGIVSDQVLAQLYRLADAFVFPSVKEGWGLVVLEAIASGLPVVVSNQAPFTEFLSATSAALVDPINVDAITNAMLEITKPEVAKQLSQQAFAILDRYSWQRSAEMHLELYFELCTL